MTSPETSTARPDDRHPDRHPGRWFILWQAQQLIWSLALIFHELEADRTFWALFIDNPPMKEQRLTSEAGLAQAFFITYGALHFLAAAVLFRRRWWAIRLSLVLLWLAMVATFATLALPFVHPDFGYLFYLPLDVITVLPVATTAWFLTSPRIAACYHRPLPINMTGAMTGALQGEGDSWRLVLLAFLLLPVLYLFFRLAQGPTSSFLANPFFLKLFLTKNLTLILHVTALLIAAGLLVWRVRPTTIPITLWLLWSWPLYVIGRTLVHYGHGAPSFVEMTVDGEQWGVYLLIRATTNHLQALLAAGWAIAWSGYLQDSAAIRQRYGSGSRLEHQDSHQAVIGIF